MSKLLVIEDGKIVQDMENELVLWNGQFSKAKKDGQIVKYIQQLLTNTKSIMVIPHSDGNLLKSNPLWKEIQKYIDKAKELNKVFILGTLAQTYGIEEKDINYLYLPLDDLFFEYGTTSFFTNIDWPYKSNELIWRGGCSGPGGNQSLRVRFTQQLYKNNSQIRLSNWWAEGKNIPNDLFGPRINYTELMKSKIFFIVDGAVIASNHMWGFATNSVPFLISNAKCWFSDFLIENVHYISIKYDLSDLNDKIKWIQENDDKAEQIAKNAYNFAKLFFSSQFQKTYLKTKIDIIISDYKYNNINNTNTIIDISNNIISNKKQVIDCFTFYNELELLYYRLKLLYNYVDKFVIVEANQTFMGNEKILYYKENKHLYKEFEDKIVHIVVDLPIKKEDININKNNQWVNENYQRICIKTELDKMNLNKDDLIIISDLDEIINPNILVNKDNLLEKGYTLEQDFYYYNLNCKHKEKWNRAKLITYGELTNLGCSEKVRHINNYIILQNAGWHLSYFGNIKFIQNKIKEFAHQEYNSDYYTNEKNITEAITNGKDLFSRSWVPIEYVSINENIINNNLPPQYNIYLRNYFNNTNNILNKNNIPIYIYFHICLIGNWKEIVSNLLFKIENSGLYKYVDEIRCIILGDLINTEIYSVLKQFDKDNKINIVLRDNNTNLYEKITINKLLEDSQSNIEKEAYVLYIHSKGVTKPDNKFVYDWVNYMSYFNIYKFDNCFKKLEDPFISAVGVNLIGQDVNPLHYSGNFWWSKMSHIQNLKPITDNYYNSPEFWITSNRGNYISLWNSNINHYQELYPFNLYENKDNIIIFIPIKNANTKVLTIGFHSNQLCERGTEVAMFDYAYYNQYKYGNKSIIFYPLNSENNKEEVVKKFKQYFYCFGYNDFKEIDNCIKELNINYFYNIKYGNNDGKLVTNCSNLVHAVFCVEPHGDKYATVSENLMKKYNYNKFVPHMINLPKYVTTNLKEELNIPNDAIVIGRYGGYDSFDIDYVKQAIKDFLNTNNNNYNIYFLFANTEPFINKPNKNIIYLDKIVDLNKKVKFINTCDCLLHARKEGETFGLVVGEFSTMNKPVITCKSQIDNSHIDILGDKAIIYDSYESLTNILNNINKLITSRTDWNAYQEYEPEKVMEQFYNVFEIV